MEPIPIDKIYHLKKLLDENAKALRDTEILRKFAYNQKSKILDSILNNGIDVSIKKYQTRLDHKLKAN